VWWEHEGRARYSLADSLLVLADSGGSNSARGRLWKVRLQELADALHIPITVCHLPPGTSKWNKIEHRLFAYISINWRGRPLVDFETIVSLIGATSTTTGRCLSLLPMAGVVAAADRGCHRATIVGPGTDAAMSQLKLEPHATYPQWNYTLAPRTA
jgi:Rhodopirellula transposase DDE domain